MRQRWFGVAMVALLVGACGGGGGGSGVPAPSPSPAPTPAATAPTIVTPPANASVAVGASAVFTVAATGDAPLVYVWRRDGLVIAGATGASFTLAPATLADSGARFSVTVSNAAGSVTSAEAVLTVVAAPAATGRLDVWAGSGLPVLSGAGTVQLSTMAAAPGSPVVAVEGVNVGGTPSLNAGNSAGSGYTWAQRLYGGDYDAVSQTVTHLRPRWLVYLKGGSLHKLNLEDAAALPQRLSSLSGLVGVSLVAQSASGDDAVLLASEPASTGRQWAVRLSMGAADAPIALTGAVAGLAGQPFLMGGRTAADTGALVTLYWWSLGTGDLRLLRSDVDGGNARTLYTLPAGNVMGVARPVVTPSGMVFVESRGSLGQQIKRLDFASETVSLAHETPANRLINALAYDGDQVYALSLTPARRGAPWDLVQVPDRDPASSRVLWASQSALDGTATRIGFTPNFVFLSDGGQTLLTARKSDGATFTLDAGAGAAWDLAGLMLPADRVFATTRSPGYQIRAWAPDGTGTPTALAPGWALMGSQAPWRLPATQSARCWSCVPQADAVIAEAAPSTAWVELGSASIGATLSTSLDTGLAVGLGFARGWGEAIGLAPAIAPGGGTFLVFSGSLGNTLNTYFVGAGAGSLANVTKLP